MRLFDSRPTIIRIRAQGAHFCLWGPWAAEFAAGQGRLRETDHRWSLYCGSRIAAKPDQQSGFLYCPDRTRVLRHQGVDGQQRNPLDSRLCHQDSVERILMNQRQAVDGNNMVADDR